MMLRLLLQVAVIVLVVMLRIVAVIKELVFGVLKCSICSVF